MRRTILMTLSLTLAGVWSLGGATGQTTTIPPVSLAPPKAAPQAGPKSQPVSPTPAINGLLPAPSPAADYDGLSVAPGEDSDAPDPSSRPVRSRAQTKLDKKGGASQQSIDDEDDALKRKLTICKSCK